MELPPSLEIRPREKSYIFREDGQEKQGRYRSLEDLLHKRKFMYEGVGYSIHVGEETVSGKGELEVIRGRLLLRGVDDEGRPVTRFLSDYAKDADKITLEIIWPTEEEIAEFKRTYVPVREITETDLKEMVDIILANG